MQKPTIAEQFPGLTHEHLRIVAEINVVERNAVAEFTRGVHADISMGLGQAMMCAQAVRGRLEQRAYKLYFEHRANSWLTFQAHSGIAYSIGVDRVPMRVQPDVPEIREMLPAERDALRVLDKTGQASLFAGIPVANGVLRMEIAQEQKKPVDSIVLLYVDAETGETFDTLSIYDGKTGAYFGTAPHAAQPQDASIADQFNFNNPANDAQAPDGKN